jgi:hypothetical protein
VDFGGICFSKEENHQTCSNHAHAARELCEQQAADDYDKCLEDCEETSGG